MPCADYDYAVSLAEEIKRDTFWPTIDSAPIVQGLNNSAFSGPGDSGSLVCFRPNLGEHKALGLLFAGTQDQSLSFVLPIQKVLDFFGVTLVSQHNI